MAKVVKDVEISWSWTGDTNVLKGYNVALALSTIDLNTSEIKVVSAFVNRGGGTTHTFKDVVLDSTLSYKVWVQTVYEGGVSTWVATTSAFTPTADATNTLYTFGNKPTKSDVGLSNVDNLSATSIRSGITIDSYGKLQGIGSGAGTIISNTKITVDANGKIQGIGTGVGTPVKNSLIGINADGTLSGAGSGQVTTAGIGAETPSGAQSKVDARLSATEKTNLAADKSIDGTKTLYHTGNKPTKTDVGLPLVPNKNWEAQPTAPTNLELVEVLDSVQVTFTLASGDITKYEVWSSVGDETAYGLIAEIPIDDIQVGETTVTIIDKTYTRITTVYYRVYAVYNSTRSNPLSGNIILSYQVPDVANMTVTPTIDSFIVNYVRPDLRLVDHFEVKKHAATTLGGLLEGSAVLVYSGLSGSFTYEIPETDYDLYHQFWVSTIKRTS